MQYYALMQVDQQDDQKGTVLAVCRRYTDSDGELALEKWDTKQWVDFPALMDASGIDGEHNYFSITEQEAQELASELTRNKKAIGQKYGRFVTIKDKVVFIGGPGGGAGGASAGSVSGKLPKATYEEGRDNTATLDEAERFIEDGIDLSSAYNGMINNASDAERGRVKDEIITTLSEQTGVEYETVNNIIKNWADTSNDSDPTALAVQQEAAKMFGSPLSSWQQQQIKDFERTGGTVYIKGNLTDLPPGPVEPIAATRSQIRTVLNAMYEHTQARLVEVGVPEYVTLRRGVSRVSMPHGSIQNIYTNTLSSFTSYKRVANGFSYQGVIIEIQIPRSRILATARTGFGCLSEAEYVIIGNNVGAGDQVKVVVGQ